MLCPQKLPYHAYRTRKIVSAGRYIDVSLSERSIFSNENKLLYAGSKHLTC